MSKTSTAEMISSIITARPDEGASFNTGASEERLRAGDMMRAMDRHADGCGDCLPGVSMCDAWQEMRRRRAAHMATLTD